MLTADVSWRVVSGGRAAHIFLAGEDVPVCGVRPVRGNGLPSIWGPYRRFGRNTFRGSVHAECWRLCPHRPRLNRPMSQEEIENE